MKLRFVSPTIVGAGGTVVELDGVDFAKVVRGLSFDGRPGDVLTVKLDVLLRDGLTFEGDVGRVEVPEDSADLLRLIGWLPPVAQLGPLSLETKDRLAALSREYRALVDEAMRS